MKVVALISGGKDSCYSMMQCVHAGHEIVALANLRPEQKDELDSFMFQTVGHHVLSLYSEAIGLPLFQGVIKKTAICQGAEYTITEDDEVEDLYHLLRNVKEKIDFDAVASGAVLSDYQRVRVENVCSRLGVTSLAYLWQREQQELLQEMIDCQLHAIIIKVAALGLDPRKHLGQSIMEMFPYLCKLNKDFGLHICGEGGEYETLTLDCPLFTKKIVIDQSDTVMHSDVAFAPVGYMHFSKMHLEDKEMDPKLTLHDRLKAINFPTQDGPLSEITLQDTDFREELNNDWSIENDVEVNDFGRTITRTVGAYVCITGVCHHGESPISMTLEEEARLVMEKLQSLLIEKGSSLAHTILVHLCINDMDTFASINSVYREYFRSSPPARVCIETSLLKTCHLKIDCLAVIEEPPSEHREVHHKRLHVQSISHWAPANIGPYSQAVKVNQAVFFSGSIGLIPGSMSLVTGGPAQETALALCHVSKVQSVIQPNMDVKNFVFVVCYVISYDAMKYAQEAFNMYFTEEDNLPFVIAIVPRLPKAASVEWHVGSHSVPVSERKGHDSVTTTDTFVIHSVGCMCGSSEGFFVVSIGLISSDLPIKVSCVLKEILDECKRVIIGLGSNLHSLLFMRVFVNEATIRSELKFTDAFLESTQSEFQFLPAVSFVQTRGLRENAVVSVLGQIVSDE